MNDPDALKWREALLDTLRPLPPYAPLLLSGGMDSMTLLAGLLALKRKPLCVAYQLGERVSMDLETARHAAAAYELELMVAVIPEDDESLVRDVRTVLELTRNPRKTAVQCVHGLIYLIAAVQERRSLSVALTGAGGIVEDNRLAKIMGADYENRKLELEDNRERNLLHGDPTGATETMKRVAKLLDFRLIEPYSREPVAHVGLSIPFPEMNRPKQKGIALRAFPEFFGDDPDTAGWWRPNSSLQVNGGLREYHDRLIGLPEVNRRRSRNVVGIYNDMLAELTGPKALF